MCAVCARACVYVCTATIFPGRGNGIGGRDGPIALHGRRGESNADACYFLSCPPPPCRPISSQLRGVNARVKLISPCLAFMATMQPTVRDAEGSKPGTAMGLNRISPTSMDPFLYIGEDTKHLHSKEILLFYLIELNVKYY